MPRAGSPELLRGTAAHPTCAGGAPTAIPAELSHHTSQHTPAQHQPLPLSPAPTPPVSLFLSSPSSPKCRKQKQDTQGSFRTHHFIVWCNESAAGKKNALWQAHGCFLESKGI